MNEFILNRMFERNLKGEMSSQELQEFKSLLESDSNVKQKFAEHKEFISAFERYGNRKALKEILEEAHTGFTYQEEGKQKKKSGRVWYYAVAASLAGLILMAVSFKIGMEYTSDKNEGTYLATSKKLKSLEDKQELILKKLSPIPSKIPSTATMLGSGILVADNGYLITNLHLIKEADSIMVYNATQQVVKAKVVATSLNYDLALLKIEDSTFEKSSALPFAFRKSESDLAEHIFSLGYPGEELVYGEGAISSLAGFNGDSLAYQISIPVNPGNSGGPVLDEDGLLVGIISGKQTSREGIGFAIKSTYVKEFIEKALESENVKLNTKNNLKGLNKKDKVRKLKPFVYQVKAY